MSVTRMGGKRAVYNSMLGRSHVKGLYTNNTTSKQRRDGKGQKGLNEREKKDT